MPDDLDLDALKALTADASEGPWEAADDGLVWAPRLGDPVSGSTEMADAAFIAAARTAVPTLIAEVERLRRHLEEVAGRLVGYKRLYDQALTEIAHATEQGAAWMDEARRQAAERDRRGDELRRAQAVVGLLSKRIADLRAEADEKFCTCESYDCHGECCGVGNCTCTTDALEATMPP